jgi:hypothetical protein
MRSTKADQLSSIVAALSGYIDIVRSLELPETAVLLDMAKLDLQMKIHAISHRELQALCDALERQHAAPRGRHVPPAAHATAGAAAELAGLPPARGQNDILLPPLRRSPRRVRKVC